MYLLRYLNSTRRPQDEQMYWIGISQLATVGVWRYNNGSIVTKVYWENQLAPQNRNNGSCVGLSVAGLWRVNHCSSKRPFLCQKIGECLFYGHSKVIKPQFFLFIR